MLHYTPVLVEQGKIENDKTCTIAIGDGSLSIKVVQGDIDIYFSNHLVKFDLKFLPLNATSFIFCLHCLLATSFRSVQFSFGIFNLAGHKTLKRQNEPPI